MDRRLTMTRSTSIRAVYGKVEDRYLDLIRRFPLRPLTTEAELESAISIIDELLDKPALSAPEQDYLEVLSGLVEAYESDHIVMKRVSDSEMLRFLLEMKGVKQSQAAKETGIAESTISEVLAGKRKLNRAQIGKLSRYFYVEPGAFAFGN